MGVVNRCGECKHWMKSVDCPREKRDDIRNPSKIGLPTCGSIACEKFDKQDFYKDKKDQDGE